MKAAKILFCFVIAGFAATGVFWLQSNRLLLRDKTDVATGVLLLIFLIFLVMGFVMLSALRRRTLAVKSAASPPDYEAVAAKIGEIEAEMKRVGLWQSEPLRPEQYDFRQAFGGDTMAYEQWLQFVLIPRVKQIIETRGEFPAHSETAAQAVREFDGRDDLGRLHTLLYEFDRLFGPVRFHGAD